ncbi:MAG: hypothetical protein AB7O26_00765 [Planctomycetaceae bacterium]
MPNSFFSSRRGSTRLITLVALAAVAAGMFYFVGTGTDEVGEEPALPTRKRAKRPAAGDVVAVSVSDPNATVAADDLKKTSPQPEKSEQKGEKSSTQSASTSPHEPIAVEIAQEPAAAAAPAAMTTIPSGEPVTPPRPVVTTPPSAARAATIPAKIARYAETLLQKNDRDGSGRLEFGEWRQLTGIPPETDADADGSLSVDELTQFVAGYGRSRRLRLVADADPKDAANEPASAEQQAAASPNEKGSDAEKKSASPRRDRKFYVNAKRVPQGLPDWFLERDADGDAQLTPAEFSPMSVRADLDDFGRLDINSDGLLTAEEYVRAATAKPAAEKTSGTAPPAAK